MNDQDLPPLPHAVAHILLGDDSEDVFTADQMHAYYARAAQAATPAPAEPLTEKRIWQMHEMSGWPAGDHHRLMRVVRAIERDHGII